MPKRQQPCYRAKEATRAEKSTRKVYYAVRWESRPMIRYTSWCELIDATEGPAYSTTRLCRRVMINIRDEMRASAIGVRAKHKVNRVYGQRMRYG